MHRWHSVMPDERIRKAESPKSQSKSYRAFCRRAFSNSVSLQSLSSMPLRSECRRPERRLFSINRLRFRSCSISTAHALAAAGVQAVPDWIPTVETIALAVQAMATIVLLVVTWQLVRATKAMASSSQALVNENKRPRVLVKLKPGIEDSQFMDLILENVGRGAALNVMFS